jgi:ABC-type antimicrobial peptide transport system permease subunit
MSYVPLAQYPDATGMVLVRVAGDAAEYAEAVRRSVQRIMPGASYVTTIPLRSIVDPNMQSWRTGAMMFVAFGALALTLAAVGLYSVIAYSVAQRRQELGVRVALGALPADLVRLVLRGGLRVVIGGIAIGSALALWAGRWISGLLFRESPTDPAVYLTVAGVLVTASLVATAFPALAAARVDPNTVLRAD